MPVLWKLSHKTNCISVDGFDEDQERTFTSRASCCTHVDSNELSRCWVGPSIVSTPDHDVTMGAACYHVILLQSWMIYYLLVLVVSAQIT